MKKRRIWMVSWYGLQAGGLERIVKIIAEALEEEYEIIMVDIPYINSHANWRRLLRPASRVNLMLVFSLFVSHMAKEQDLIITHGQNAPFVKADLLFDHGSIMSLKREMGEFIYGGSSVFEYIAVRRAKLNIAVSEWTEKQLKRNYHIRKDKVVMLHNCVEENIFYPIPRKQREKTVILFCGRLEKAKGLEQLLQLAQVLEKRNDLELKIAANDTENRELFQGRRNIEVVCEVPIGQMNDFYNRGDVLFVPSRCEGFGMGIVESLSAGVPVVSNRVGIVEELLKERCPGIAGISGEEIGAILDKLQCMAGEYQNWEKRKQMHQYMAENYGVNEYKKQLKSLLERNSLCR